MDLEKRVIATLRLESAHPVDQESGWELWRYRLRDPASQTQLPQDMFLLFLKSRGVNKSDLPQLRTRLRDVTRNGKISVAVQRSSPLADDLNLVKSELRASSVKLLSELLQQESRYLIGDSSASADSFPYFVEPLVDSSPALSSLASWLLKGREQDVRDSVAVLLAPAGVGKTSVARELARILQQRPEHDVLPLLIESSQWSSLNPNEPPSLWALIKHALETGGHNAISETTFELFAKAGCIVPIFDGLDEVGSIRGSSITPVNVLQQLRALAEESDCRVLLTSRDGLWAEMVPAELRHNIREFSLRPFRREQIARYREKRFPNPKRPERERFDEILRTVTDAAHPKGTANTDIEERAPAAPLILHLAATEAEESVDGAAAYGLGNSQYQNPLYAITFGILNREHRLRNLHLTPSQQFMMISTLVVDMGSGPYSIADVQTAAEYAYGAALPEGQSTALKSHPLLRQSGNGNYVFRFEYLTQFAPAVWLCDYIIGTTRNQIVEKYLGSIAGRSSPVSSFVAELLSQSDWRSNVTKQVARLRKGDLDGRLVIPFLWEVAQYLLPGSMASARTERTSTMGEIFGAREEDKIVFDGIVFSGPISYLDLRGTVFRNCTFENCEWISCDAGANTAFIDCLFRGRFAVIQSTGFKEAVFSPLSEENVDNTARSEFERLLDRASSITTSIDAVTGMLISLLQQFRGPGFFVPRTREQLATRYIGPVPIRDFMIDQLLKLGVLEEHETRGYQVYKKNGASVLALLDNGTLNGPVRAVAQAVAGRFKAIE